MLGGEAENLLKRSRKKYEEITDKNYEKIQRRKNGIVKKRSDWGLER
jgi:hypothetical protein